MLTSSESAPQVSEETITAPLIEVRDVCCNLGGRQILNNVSLNVRRGEVLVIIGPSGAGKTTLLRCINHLQPITSGTIRVNGELIGYVEDENAQIKPDSGRNTAKRRRQIGFVFQHFNLYPHMTVLENIWHGPSRVLKRPKSETKAEAYELLERVGLADKSDAHPMNLSGGQQQRVAIARALAMRPSVMLFDEPTSALDPEMTGEVLDVMKDLASEGMTMMLASHEMGFAREVADEIVVMIDGAIIESAPPSELFENAVHERTREFLSKVL